MTISDTDLLSSLTTLVEPLLQDFQSWVATRNNHLKAMRHSSSTHAFPASISLSFVRSPVAAEALVVAITFERKGSTLTGRADLSTGAGRILAQCREVELAESDPQLQWEGRLRKLEDQMRFMLRSAKAAYDVELALEVT